MKEKLGPISGPQFGLLEWTQSALIVDPQVAVEKIARDAMSASTMKSLESCPARWAADKALPENPDPFGPAEVGTSGHKVLEELLKLPKGQRSRDRAMRIAQAMAPEVLPGPAQKMAGVRGLWTVEVWNAISQAWKLLDLQTTEPHRLEWKVEAKIGGVPFHGIIDLSRRVNGGLTVDDWKTAAKLPVIKTQGDAHGDQARLYFKTVEIETGERPVEANILYTRLGISKTVALAAPRMRDTIERFKQAWDLHNGLIDHGRFPAKPSSLCGWCPLVGACPAAARENKVPRKEGMRLVDVPLEKLTFVETELTPETVIVEPAAADSNYLDNQPSEEETMDDNRTEYPLKYDDKPYVQDIDGQANPSSYGFINASVVVSWAFFYLDRRGVKTTTFAVDTVIDTLADLTAEVQYRLSGSTNWQRGTRARAMHTVRQVLWAMPIPFGAPVDQLDEWRERVVDRAEKMLLTTLALWGRDTDPEAPWRDLSELEPTLDAHGQPFPEEGFDLNAAA